jgi:hypothetical protein
MNHSVAILRGRARNSLLVWPSTLLGLYLLYSSL